MTRELPRGRRRGSASFVNRPAQILVRDSPAALPGSGALTLSVGFDSPAGLTMSCSWIGGT